MSEYSAKLAWQRGEQEAFTDHRYSRRHALRFDGGAQITGSSSPSVVRPPYSDPAGVDPEELFVASLASCHMLWFLSIAARQGYTVQRYEDDALGTMARNAQGRMAMTQVRLRPRVSFAAPKLPNVEELAALHREAHHECFIANSVHTEVLCEPQPADQDLVPQHHPFPGP